MLRTHPFLELRSLDQQHTIRFEQFEAMEHGRHWVWQMFQHIHQSDHIEATGLYAEASTGPTAIGTPKVSCPKATTHGLISTPDASYPACRIRATKLP